MSNVVQKSALLTIRLSPERLEEFRIAAMLRGTTMSSLVSQFVAQVVREEINAVPAAFKRRAEHKHPDQSDNNTHGLVDLIQPE